MGQQILSLQLQCDYIWALGSKEQKYNEKHTVGHSCPETLPQNVAYGHQHLLLSSLLLVDPYLASVGFRWLY